MLSWAWGLKFSQSLHLHPYFVCASSEGSGESAQISEPSLLDSVINKYQNLTCWLIIVFVDKSQDLAALDTLYSNVLTTCQLP